jgi:Na+-transporting methylmalonyl-CoA/oxaloacetate decarboxylase gamma subunit
MTDLDFLTVCGAAFLSIFLILATLALMMRLLSALFSESAKGPDPAVIAAISTTYRSVYPNSRIINIEETQ